MATFLRLNKPLFKISSIFLEATDRRIFLQQWTTTCPKSKLTKLDAPQDSFDKPVQHLTSHLSSDLHKLRTIFVWMGAQNIGCRQENGSCEDINSLEYYLQEASNKKIFIAKMFAKMCRAARIPCVLVSGKAKDGSYQPGVVDVKGQCTYAVVYVANSWRFVFPHWAFVVAKGYQKENLVLVEHSGKPVRTRVAHEMIDTRLLTRAAHLDVTVLFLATLSLLCNAQHVKGSSFTCDVPSVEPLANTSITCHFPENVSQTRRDVTVSFFKGMDWREEDNILDCWWLSGRMGCHVQPGYSFNRMISNELTLEIHQVSAKYIGGYACKLSNMNPNDIKLCELKLKIVAVTSFCNISSVKESEPTSLTCTFNVDVNATKKNFSLVRFGGVDGKDINIVTCTWVKDELNCTTAPGYEFNNTVKNQLVITVPRASRNHTGKYACHVTGNTIDDFQPCTLILQQDLSNKGMILAIIMVMLIPVSLVVVILVFKFKLRVTASKAEDIPLLSREEDPKLWELEEWYPPLRPPDTLKQDINEDFTEVDKNALAKFDSPKDSFGKLVQHLTSHLNSNLHKLRAIFVWMGAQNIGFRQERGSCKDSKSPEYYLQEAFNDNRLIDIMFAKMCRFSSIPCVLVNGKAKDASYEPGDVEMKEYTWAIVYVATSWRFVFPRWAFSKTSGYQKEHFMLVEDSVKPTKTRLTANVGITKPDFDEFYFLTDPEEMIYICLPHDEDKQLLPEPWTQEKFLELPCFSNSYFSSGWKLINPLTSVIKSKSGWCFIGMFSPGIDYKLTYKMVYDEGRSGSEFPEEIQMDRCVTIIKQTQQTESFVVRLLVTGTYKFEVMGVHQGQATSLVKFQIICDNVAPDTQPFPFCPENGFGFGEAAAEAGLSEASHMEGLVPVKSGDEISLQFKVNDHVDISARLVDSTRMSHELLDNVSVRRKDGNATVTATSWEADAHGAEYSIEVDTRKNIKEKDESRKSLFDYHLLNEKANAVTKDKAKEKIDKTCVSKVAGKQDWFEGDQEEIRGMALSLRKKDEATVEKPPDHVINVIVAAFILIGEREEELNTWQKVNAKMKKTNEEQLFQKVNSLDNSSLTRDRVDLAAQKLERPGGTFAEYRPIETLKKQCLDKITFYRTKGSLKKVN